MSKVNVLVAESCRMVLVEIYQVAEVVGIVRRCIGRGGSCGMVGRKRRR